MLVATSFVKVVIFLSASPCTGTRQSQRVDILHVNKTHSGAASNVLGPDTLAPSVNVDARGSSRETRANSTTVAPDVLASPDAQKRDKRTNKTHVDSRINLASNTSVVAAPDVLTPKSLAQGRSQAVKASGSIPLDRPKTPQDILVAPVHFMHSGSQAVQAHSSAVLDGPTTPVDILVAPMHFAHGSSQIVRANISRSNSTGGQSQATKINASRANGTAPFNPNDYSAAIGKVFVFYFSTYSGEKVSSVETRSFKKTRPGTIRPCGI